MESQNVADMAAAMEEMRAEGAFAEYAEGEHAVPDAAAITAGEKDEDGHTRIYYFYPEEYPKLFERKEAIEEACEVAVREVLSLLQQ